MTRQLLLELGAAAEEDLPVAALAGADEAFLTSSTRDIQPIASVDGNPIPAAPGALTKAAMDAFAGLCEGNDDP